MSQACPRADLLVSSAARLGSVQLCLAGLARALSGPCVVEEYSEAGRLLCVVHLGSSLTLGWKDNYTS